MRAVFALDRYHPKSREAKTEGSSGATRTAAFSTAFPWRTRHALNCGRAVEEAAGRWRPLAFDAVGLERRAATGHWGRAVVAVALVVLQGLPAAGKLMPMAHWHFRGRMCKLRVAHGASDIAGGLWMAEIATAISRCVHCRCRHSNLVVPPERMCSSVPLPSFAAVAVAVLPMPYPPVPHSSHFPRAGTIAAAGLLSSHLPSILALSQFLANFPSLPSSYSSLLRPCLVADFGPFASPLLATISPRHFVACHLR